MTTSTLDRRSTNRDGLLRRALLGNALFSAVSGGVLMLFAWPLGTLLGSVPPWLLVLIGAGLVGFAIDVWRHARRGDLDLAHAQRTVFSDVVWVVGSVVILVAQPSTLSATGLWVVADVALVVLAFAAAQQLGIRRLLAGRDVSRADR